MSFKAVVCVVQYYQIEAWIPDECPTCLASFAKPGKLFTTVYDRMIQETQLQDNKEMPGEYKNDVPLDTLVIRYVCGDCLTTIAGECDDSI